MAKITQTAGRNALGEFAPEFAHFNDDVLFGENWNNQDIDVKTRSIITSQVGIFNVTFEPGCRNNWHIHHAKNGGGQILVCVAGRGYYQEEGKEAIEMKPGDCINIPAEVKHWHGAAPDSWFSHLAVEVPGEETSNEWCELVSDEEYAKLK